VHELAARLTAQLGIAFEDAAALDHVLGELVARGEGALPHCPVTREAFVDRIAAAFASTNTSVTLATLAELRAEELYLACALASGDGVAVRIIESELMPAAREAVRKIDRAPGFVDDVIQDVRLRVMVGEHGAKPAIAQYRGTGPLASWIRIIARRIAIDRKRATTHADDDDALDDLPAPDDPELAVIWRDCADAYRSALSQALRLLSRRDRTLLRQRYVDGLHIEALGRVHGVNPATAFRWIKRAEQELLVTIRAVLAERLALSDSQLQSMERFAADHLPLSLSGLLRQR
jgi:RNA polymerase sigma-70 factor (ECF subfamily)